MELGVDPLGQSCSSERIASLVISSSAIVLRQLTKSEQNAASLGCESLWEPILLVAVHDALVRWKGV